MTSVSLSGAAFPNWRFDTILLSKALAEAVADQFRLDLRPVHFTGRAGRDEIVQIVIPTVYPEWFDTEALTEITQRKHGKAGKHCESCDRWRWMPIRIGDAPPVKICREWSDWDALASPEWFGDGKQSYRHFLLRRGLAEMMHEATRGSFSIIEVQSEG